MLQQMPTRPRDTNQLAKMIVDLTTREEGEKPSYRTKEKAKPNSNASSPSKSTPVVKKLPQP